MTVRKLRWGILGTAKINNRVLPSFHTSASAEAYAIASRSIDKAKQAAAAAGIPNAFGSYEELLADPNVEAVYVPLPNSLHGEWVKKAADAGKHILCEKPLAPTAAEAAQLVAHCRAKNVRLMDGFMWPHHPRTGQLAGLIRGGSLGRVKRVTGAFTFPMGELSQANIRLRPELGGGSLLDVGCYPVFGIRWAFGEEPVRAWAAARYEHGCDVEMAGTLWFADGRMATFDCGFTSPFRIWHEVVCEGGGVHVPDMWLPRPQTGYELFRGEDQPERVPVEPADQIACMLDEFAAAVHEGRDPANPPEESVKTLRVLDALAKSAREGKAVDV